jgi:hypothetical protein
LYPSCSVQTHTLTPPTPSLLHMLHMLHILHRIPFPSTSHNWSTVGHRIATDTRLSGQLLLRGLHLRPLTLLRRSLRGCPVCDRLSLFCGPAVRPAGAESRGGAPVRARPPMVRSKETRGCTSGGTAIRRGTGSSPCARGWACREVRRRTGRDRSGKVGAPNLLALVVM